MHGLPLFHVHGLVLGVLGALRVGSRLVHTGRPTPAAYAAAADRRRHAVLRGADRVVTGGRRPGRRRPRCAGPACWSPAAPDLPAPVFERLAGLTGQGPVERYGMTETCITLSARADGDRRAGWVGRPVAGVETRLVDDRTTAGAGRRRDRRGTGGSRARP